MLFVIFVILLVIGIVAYTQDWCELFIFPLAIGFIGTGVSIGILIALYIGIPGEIAANNVRYDALVYQYENDIYENDNDLGKRELMKDIQNWNEQLARNQENQDDLWIGIYIPNIYDQFEFIELGGN